MSTIKTDLGSTVTRALPTGVAAGIASYVVSYVVLFVFLLLEGGDMLQQEAWKAAGMVFYNAHNVDITASALGQSQSVNLLSMSSGFSSIPIILYYLVPVVVLVLMGYTVARMANVGSDVAGAALAGATVTGGYLVMAIVGTFLFTTSAGGASAGPDLVMSVLLAGLAYPIVAGGLGGAIVGATN